MVHIEFLRQQHHNHQSKIPHKESNSMKAATYWTTFAVAIISCLEWAFLPGGSTFLSLGVVGIYFSYVYYAVASPISNEKFIEGVVHDFYLESRHGKLEDDEDVDDDSIFFNESRRFSRKRSCRRISSSSFDDENDDVRGTSKRGPFSLKSVVTSLLRGGYYDVTNHYTSPIPPPPPPQSWFDGQDSPKSCSADAMGCRRSNTESNGYKDQAPAQPFVPAGMWERYVRATQNNFQEAQRRLDDTLRWRAENGMDSILNSPHPSFRLIKRYYPHAFHLHGYYGEPVYYESPAKMNLQALKNGGLTLENLLRHYALITEFMWNYISPHQDGPRSKGITVLDLEGMRLRDFAGEVISFVKQASIFTSLHYPERSGNIFILNPPSFFQVVWRVVQPLVDPITLEKIRVVDSSNQDSIRTALMERIPVENIPRKYGGSSTIPLGYGPEEQLLRQLMDHNNYHLKEHSSQATDSGVFNHCPFCNH